MQDCKVVRELPGYVYKDVTTTPATVEECAAFIQRMRDMGKPWRRLTIMNIITGRLMSHVVR